MFSTGTADLMTYLKTTCSWSSFWPNANQFAVSLFTTSLRARRCRWFKHFWMEVFLLEVKQSEGAFDHIYSLYTKVTQNLKWTKLCLLSHYEPWLQVRMVMEKVTFTVIVQDDTKKGNFRKTQQKLKKSKKKKLLTEIEPLQLAF